METGCGDAATWTIPWRSALLRYEGRVASFDGERHHAIEYDDGERAAYDMRTETYELIEDAPSGEGPGLDAAAPAAAAPGRHRTGRPCEMRRVGEAFRRFASQTEAARAFGLSSGQVSNLANGKANPSVSSRYEVRHVDDFAPGCRKRGRRGADATAAPPRRRAHAPAATAAADDDSVLSDESDREPPPRGAAVDPQRPWLRVGGPARDSETDRICTIKSPPDVGGWCDVTLMGANGKIEKRRVSQLGKPLVRSPRGRPRPTPVAAPRAAVPAAPIPAVPADSPGSPQSTLTDRDAAPSVSEAGQPPVIATDDVESLATWATACSDVFGAEAASAIAAFVRGTDIKPSFFDELSVKDIRDSMKQLCRLNLLFAQTFAVHFRRAWPREDLTLPHPQAA